MACDVLIDLERVIVGTFCGGELDQAGDEAIFPSELADTMEEVCLSAAEVALNEFEARSLFEQ